MKEPSLGHYILVIFICLVLALAGLYLLANFQKLFRRNIRNEVLRKNVVAWLVIFCLSTAMAPLNGGFFYIIAKHGWMKAWMFQLASTTLNTLFVFNTVRWLAENVALRKLSFVKHKLIMLAGIVISCVIVNLPISYVLYGNEKRYLNYSIISSIYLGGTIGLVYGVISYLDRERKKKFDEKELELSRLRELKSKAELDALHSKVNPHFLYNALNSIADLSVTDGKKARKMTIALADLFRYSINYSQNNFSTINDEVAMTEVYLQIEKIRFEDQLNYKVNTSGEIGHYLVPRFLLQPIIENAVKHGLKVTGRMTEIFLEIRKEGETLVINIHDNGPAFPDDLIPGYGVKSVFDKLDLLFPGQYEIHFTNQPEKKVGIVINKLIKNEFAI